MIKIFDDYSDVLSVNEVASALNISKGSMYKLLQNKEIKSVRIGRIYKVPKIYLIQYLEKLAQE